MIEIRWHGYGGQGSVTAAKLAASASLREGKHFQAFPEYGPERRGAPLQAFTRIDEAPIRIFSHVVTPDIVMVMNYTLIGKAPITDGLNDNGLIIANFSDSPEQLRTRLALEEGYAKIWTVNATEIAQKILHRPIPNTTMLGALVRATKFVSMNTMISEINDELGARYGKEVVEANVNAFKQGYELAVEEGRR